MATFMANLTASIIACKLHSSILDTPNLENPRYFTDLSRSTNLLFATVKDSHVAQYLQRSNLEYMRKIWLRIEKCGAACLVTNVDEGIRRATQGGVVFIWESPLMRYHASRDCRLRHIEQTFDFLSYAMVTSKDSRYGDEISDAITKLMESEQLNSLRKKLVIL